MSEQIDNSKFRKAKLKELILKLHHGDSEEDVRKELLMSLSKIPYGEVVEVEQELISEGLPEEEVLKLCDAHSAVLEGRVDLSASKTVPDGHPIDIMIHENLALKKVSQEIMSELSTLENTKDENLDKIKNRLKGQYNQLTDVDKHYQRKEYLIFPYLEQAGITGPPKVMWGKHDEIRDQLKGSLEILNTPDISKDELVASADLVLRPAAKGVAEMVTKEEEILFPMLMDTLSDSDWYEVQKQSLEIGYCLYDPPVEWKPEGIESESVNEAQQQGGQIHLPSGSFSAEELMTILNTGPFDMTFVDKNDKVKYFTQGEERIFQRNRAILNRDVRHCHPPASAHIVDKILEDFKSGKESRAPFWIQLNGKFIHIEYFALRNDKGEYLGTLEVSQDLTEKENWKVSNAFYRTKKNKKMAKENTLIITPKTKVLQLIEHYPQLEDVLIEYAPAFKKLKNPVLRKTVAKIATLQQAASIGNVKVEDLINRLRKGVGQDLLKETEDANYNTDRPEWFDEQKVKTELNASEMLEAGEQPVSQVVTDLKKLPKNEIYKLQAPFLPAPIIDKATSLNFQHWVDKKSDDEVFVYFYNEENSPEI